jgi:hypothetical protein
MDCLEGLGGPFHNKSVFTKRGLMRGKSMFAAVGVDGIVVKVPPAEYEAALKRPGVRPFKPGGERKLGTWVEVSEDVVADDPELREWRRRDEGRESRDPAATGS